MIQLKRTANTGRRRECARKSGDLAPLHACAAPRCTRGASSGHCRLHASSNMLPASRTCGGVKHCAFLPALRRCRIVKHCASLAVLMTPRHHVPPPSDERPPARVPVGQAAEAAQQPLPRRLRARPGARLSAAAGLGRAAGHGGQAGPHLGALCRGARQDRHDNLPVDQGRRAGLRGPWCAPLPCAPLEGLCTILPSFTRMLLRPLLLPGKAHASSGQAHRPARYLRNLRAPHAADWPSVAGLQQHGPKAARGTWRPRTAF